MTNQFSTLPSDKCKVIIRRQSNAVWVDKRCACTSAIRCTEVSTARESSHCPTTCSNVPDLTVVLVYHYSKLIV